MALVFIIDDVEEVAGWIKEHLTSAGFDVIIGGDSGKAIEMLPSIKPDVITTDWCNYPYSGTEISDRVRKIHPNIPIVLISGLPAATLEQYAVQMGAIFWVSKPFRHEQLVEVIRRALL
jgi:DNA-binding NtrC family response regulator